MTTSTPITQPTVRPVNRRRRDAESPAAEAAFRMMSETAHDIRSPLTTIRESVRLVHDGDLGGINPHQRDCLAAAIDQCNCMDQMVGEMVQLERLRTGLPRARRHWVSVSSIRASISETLRPWALPRAIQVLWDGADNPEDTVFGDASMIRRLVVNLVSNAIRVTADGGSILIRVTPERDGSVMRWTVVDQGPGISDADMIEITKRQVSLGGGEGLGLSICRQLSALHFSDLKIESRIGTGTAVSFETAAGGPSSVAECWARWREGQREPMQRPLRRDADGGPPRKAPAPRSIRIDNPTSIAELSCEGTAPQFEDRISAGTVTLGAAMPRQAADAFDQILHTHMRMFDFAYRVDERHWVWVIDADQRTAPQRVRDIEDAADSQIENIRLSWSEAQIIPLDQRRTASRLSDLLVRKALASAKTPVENNTQLHLGAAPLPESIVATERLQEELRWLTQRLKMQTDRIQQQANRMRPN